ncbi:MAG TPA: hypothetical protein VF116_18745 [Ktedonobacterales bacterium]
MAERQASTAQAVRQTVQQRGAEATRRLREALRLPADVNDTTILGTAVAEVAARESLRNPHFAAQVRTAYDELAAMKRRPGANRRPSVRQEHELPPLIPIRRIEGPLHIDPFKAPDPERLAYIYGKNQLARALQGLRVDTLKEMAAKIEQRYPGTKPTNRGHSNALIAYIVEHTEQE